MTRQSYENIDPIQDGSDEDLGFHSMEYGEYKVEFEFISRQRGVCCILYVNQANSTFDSMA